MAAGPDSVFTPRAYPSCQTTSPPNSPQSRVLASLPPRARPERRQATVPPRTNGTTGVQLL
uniref:Uncharacterized protein n=1 Tax=Oryza glumipatula TaxID=40148 RepID=A0A0E0A8B2_9ORYZ